MARFKVLITTLTIVTAAVLSPETARAQDTNPAHAHMGHVADGFRGTCPVRTYPANGYGLYNVAGNVWEWCADWFSPDHHLTAPRADPTGPARGSNRVMRGGSFLCHRSYCNRYRVGARTGNTPDSSTANCGVRLAFPPDSQEASL